jgi:subtilase family serine protease
MAKEPTMRKVTSLRFMPVAGAAVLTTGLAASLVLWPSTAVSAGARHDSGNSQLAVRTPGPRFAILGASAAGSISASAAAPSGLPSKQKQIQVLTAVLKKMQKDYEKYAAYSPGPQDIVDYGIGSLWKKGIDGAGTTVAVIEGWDYPGIAKEVASFDKLFGLPNPEIQTIYPSGDGKLPARCPAGMVKLGSYGSCSAWQGELSLDVITAHLVAPYAKILISVTPADSEIVDDAASQVAPPEMMEALEQISSHHLANVISISDGTGETTYSAGKAEVTAQDPGELAAAAAGIPVVVGTGDCGVVQNLAVANGQCKDVSKTPDTAAWDDSPWVTAVGGSVPNFSSSGVRLGPDPLWHVDGRFSEGAGYSSVFTRPTYQKEVAAITKSPMRSVPDITMDAQDGTSEAGPMLAGVLALATQFNHANVGPINSALYGVLGPRGTKDGIVDVVSGNNSAETPTGQVIVPGFTATEGFDVASGWGTLFAPSFVPALVSATRSANEDRAVRHEAYEDLKSLERFHLSSTDVPAGGESYLFAGGFLPHHPVRLLIDDYAIATLTANTLGSVTYMIDPSMLKLSAGTHKITLKSMLVTATGTFRSS